MAARTGGKYILRPVASMVTARAASSFHFLEIAVGGDRRDRAKTGDQGAFLSLGVEPTGTTPEALAAIMAADTARWAPIIKASGFTAE